MPENKSYVVHLSFMEMDAVTLPIINYEEAKKTASDCRGRMCQVERDQEEVARTPPPQLYELPSLQEEAARVLGYSGELTKELAFSLYEKKLLTDPAAASRYLPEELGYPTEKLIRILHDELPFLGGYRLQPEVRQMFGPAGVGKGHAILPIPAAKGWASLMLGKEERNLLYLVGARVMMAAADTYIREHHKSQLTCNYHTFFLDAFHTKKEGYREIEKRMEAFFGCSREAMEGADVETYLGKVFGPCDTSIWQLG